jgi:hypothetical protein
MTTTTTTDPPNVAPQLLEAERARAAAREALIDALTRARDDNRRAWIDAGGCTRCGGTGRMVTASYSDGDDYGPCTGWRAGDEQSHPTGSMPIDFPGAEHAGEVWTGYTRRRIARDVPCTAGDVAPYTDNVDGLPAHVRAELADLEESVAIAEESEAGARRRYTPHVGARVLVVRGRKVKIGTEAIVVWQGLTEDYSERYTRMRDRRGVQRIGVDVDGKRVYTDASNVRVLDPSPAIDCPDLYGTEKQVAWAERLRLDAIRAGLPIEQARMQASARWWIDTYGASARKVAEVRT